MEDIRKVFAIQWGGPFKTLADMKSYLNKPDTCDESQFSFYYFRGKKKGTGYGRKPYSYFGIHKGEHITWRLTQTHEHYKAFFEDDNMRIWIGRFSDKKWKKPGNIEDVETVFVRVYNSEKEGRCLTENRKKTQSVLKESVCIINRWYCQSNEELWKRKKTEILDFADVLVYEKDLDSFCVGSLSYKKEYISKK